MNSGQLNFDPNKMRFTGVIGTGGIGAGKFFVLNGNHTLGREESRNGHFLDIHDYCKQHIILYYIRKLLGKRLCGSTRHSTAGALCTGPRAVNAMRRGG